MTGNASARQGSMTISSPSLNERMCSWQVVVTSGPCAWPLIISPHMPQMPSRQSESKATGSSPLAMSCSLSTSSISRNDMSAEMSVDLVGVHRAGGVGVRLAPDLEGQVLHL